MFNIAVAYEVLGDLENAKKWASDSYVKYKKVDLAPGYINALNKRISQESLVKQQMDQ